MSRIIHQSTDRLKKISKKDIIFFFEQIINDMNIISDKDFRIDITSATYNKKESSLTTKKLVIKFILTNNSGKHYYRYDCLRAKDWSCINVNLTKAINIKDISCREIESYKWTN